MNEHYLKKIPAEALESRNRRKKLTKSSSSSKTNSLGAYRTLERTGTFSRCINCIAPRKTNDLSLGALILMRYELSMSFSTKSSSNGQLEVKLSNLLEDNVTYFNFSLMNLLNLWKNVEVIFNIPWDTNASMLNNKKRS